MYTIYTIYKYTIPVTISILVVFYICVYIHSKNIFFLWIICFELIKSYIKSGKVGLLSGQLSEQYFRILQIFESIECPNCSITYL